MLLNFLLHRDIRPVVGVGNIDAIKVQHFIIINATYIIITVRGKASVSTIKTTFHSKF